MYLYMEIESNYSNIEKEALAIVSHISRAHKFLLSRKFLLKCGTKLLNLLLIQRTNFQKYGG